jgi:hypothetical protein
MAGFFAVLPQIRDGFRPTVGQEVFKSLADPKIRASS